MDGQPLTQQSKSSSNGLTIQYPAYRGDGPFVFISYAHANSDMVFAEIARLNEMGVNVWYDEGIAPGNEWNEDIAQALSDCSLFVVMMTNRAAQSQNVRNEINYAISEKKPFIAIHLEETELSGGLKLQIGSMQAILKYLMSDEEYVRRLSNALVQRGISIDDAYAPYAQTRSVAHSNPSGQNTKAFTPTDDNRGGMGGSPITININSFNNSVNSNNNINSNNTGYGYAVSQKSRLVTLMLCIFIGYIGAHNFYAGRIGRGILFLLTFGLFGFGWLWDIVQIFRGKFIDNHGLAIIN